MEKLSELSIGWSLVVYAVAVIVVWVSGAKLTGFVDEISDRTGLGKAFAGFMLLAIATSFPELVTVIASARIGEADLIGSNMAGGVCMQTVLLVLVDWRYGKRALTGSAPMTEHLMGGVVVMLMLAIALIGFTLGDKTIVWHVGIVGVVLFAAMLGGMRIMYTFQNSSQWRPENPPEIAGSDEGSSFSGSSLKLYGGFALLTVFVGIAGTLVTYTSESISRNWNIGSGFAGAVFIAISTSLPELSASLQAVKMNRTPMAIGNIFGSNLYDVALLFVADIFYTKGALFSHFTKVTGFYMALGVVLTAVYLLGMLERRDKSYWRLGTDSITVLGLYVAGLIVTYFIS